MSEKIAQVNNVRTFANEIKKKRIIKQTREVDKRKDRRISVAKSSCDTFSSIDHYYIHYVVGSIVLQPLV
jgi:hypothetical protein